MKLIYLVIVLLYFTKVRSQLIINNTALAKCFWIFNQTNVFNIKLRRDSAPQTE